LPLGHSSFLDLRANTERRVHPSGVERHYDIDYRFTTNDEIAGDISLMLKQTGAQTEHSTSMMMYPIPSHSLRFPGCVPRTIHSVERLDLPLVFKHTGKYRKVGGARYMSSGRSREKVIQITF